MPQQHQDSAITVHLLSNQLCVSHIEILLETTDGFYALNRWKEPRALCFDSYNFFVNKKEIMREFITCNLGSHFVTRFSFPIHANVQTIIDDWQEYFNKTPAGIFNNNCAVATQWFLSKYAELPYPSTAYTSWDNTIFWILWPSFIPCPVLLPDRVGKHAEFYLTHKSTPEIANQYSDHYIYACLALNASLYLGSIVTIVLANTIIHQVKTSIIITALASILNVTSLYYFGESKNMLYAKQIAEDSTPERQGLMP